MLVNFIFNVHHDTEPQVFTSVYSVFILKALIRENSSILTFAARKNESQRHDRKKKKKRRQNLKMQQNKKDALFIFVTLFKYSVKCHGCIWLHARTQMNIFVVM